MRQPGTLLPTTTASDNFFQSLRTYCRARPSRACSLRPERSPGVGYSRAASPHYQDSGSLVCEPDSFLQKAQAKRVESVLLTDSSIVKSAHSDKRANASSNPSTLASLGLVVLDRL